MKMWPENDKYIKAATENEKTTALLVFKLLLLLLFFKLNQLTGEEQQG